MLARKQFLGNYQILKTIGQGAFSKVKLGIHKETGQKVAIKIIDKKQMALKTSKAKKAAEDREKKKKVVQQKGGNEHPHHETEAPITGAGGDIDKAGKAGATSDQPRDPRGQVTDNVNSNGGVGGKRTRTATEVSTGESSHRERAGSAGTNRGAANNSTNTNKESRSFPQSSEPTFVSTLQPEVQLLMRLDHPNVINLYQVMETEDECFVVMEFAAGGELVEYIAARNYLTEKEARRLFRQIVSAMDHCHLANVVHRDLKLENLLLTEQKNIIISDFGLGRTFLNDKDDLMKTFCGTPNYAAVELISGIPYIGVKSDIWAMGVVLYVMMTGRPPFAGSNISALYSKIKAVDYRCPDYFSKELRNLLGKILKKDPNARVDMDSLRADPWVNFEESGPPPRIIPKISTKLNPSVGPPDPSQLATFIKSITRDSSFVVFTIRQYMRDGTNIDGASVEKNQTLQRNLIAAGSSTNSNLTASGAGGRRRSYSMVPPTSTIQAHSGSSISIARTPQPNIGEEGEEDEAVSGLESRQIGHPPTGPPPPPSAFNARRRRMSMQETSLKNRQSLDVPSAPRTPVGTHTRDVSDESDEDGGVYVAPALPSPGPRVRRNTISLVLPGDVSQGSRAHEIRSGSISYQHNSSDPANTSGDDSPALPHRHRRASLGIPFGLPHAADDGRNRRSSASGTTPEYNPGPEDRATTFMRRMSMVSPQAMERRKSAGSRADDDHTDGDVSNTSAGHGGSHNYSSRSSANQHNGSSSGVRIDTANKSRSSTSVNAPSPLGITSPTEGPSSATSSKYPNPPPLPNDATRRGSSRQSSTVEDGGTDDCDDIVPTKQEIEEWHIMHHPPKEIRSVRYSFNPNLTSTLTPSTIFQDVHRVMLQMQQMYGEGRLSFRRERKDYYLLHCDLRESTEDDVNVCSFEIEVCKVWLLKLHGVRIKRVSGSALVFKDVYTAICDSLNIRGQ